MGGSSVLCGIFRSIPGLYPFDTSSTSSPSVTAKNISRHCQISPHVTQNCLQFRKAERKSRALVNWQEGKGIGVATKMQDSGDQQLGWLEAGLLCCWPPDLRVPSMGIRQVPESGLEESTHGNEVSLSRGGGTQGLQWHRTRQLIMEIIFSWHNTIILLSLAALKRSQDPHISWYQHSQGPWLLSKWKLHELWIFQANTRQIYNDCHSWQETCFMVGIAGGTCGIL